MKKNSLIVSGFVCGLMLVASRGGCRAVDKPGQKPLEIPPGILVDRVPENADLLFVSMRYILQDLACLNSNYVVKEEFLNDPA